MRNDFSLIGRRDGASTESWPPLGRGGSLMASASELDDCLERLEAVLVEEVATLSQLSPATLHSLNQRKSTLLLELDRRVRDARGDGITNGTPYRLGRIKVHLEENLRLLSLHLAAANEIVAIIRRSVERAEGDGTYSMSLFFDEWSR